FGPTGLSASLCSRASAIALAVASILRSGRWLGGLRFEIAVDSRGDKGKASLWQRRASRATRQHRPSSPSPSSSLTRCPYDFGAASRRPAPFARAGFGGAFLPGSRL